MKFISVDVGWNTGVSYWEDGKLILNREFHLTQKQKNEMGIAHRISHLTLIMNSLIKELPAPIELMVIEGVSLWGQSKKSQTAALRGDSFNLAYLVGSYIHCADCWGIPAEIVDVRTWKGTLPTDVLIKHVERLTGVKPMNEHVACSMGIGLWKLGKL